MNLSGLINLISIERWKRLKPSGNRTGKSKSYGELCK